MLDSVDLPRLESLSKYWTHHPPVAWMVASYFGIKKPAVQNIEEVNEYVPADTLPREEFDKMLKEMGL